MCYVRLCGRRSAQACQKGPPTGHLYCRLKMDKRHDRDQCHQHASLNNCLRLWRNLHEVKFGRWMRCFKENAVLFGQLAWTCWMSASQMSRSNPPQPPERFGPLPEHQTWAGYWTANLKRCSRSIRCQTCGTFGLCSCRVIIVFLW